jgi:hypothetical protein
MTDPTETIDNALAKILSHLEDGSADLPSTRILSEAIHFADLTPSNDLREVLVWQDKNWWANQEELEIRRGVSEVLRLWANLWTIRQGVFAYRAAAIRSALERPRTSQPRAALSDGAQEFIEDEIPEIAPRMTKEWIENTITLLSPSLRPERAILMESVLRAALKEKHKETAFPDELLESIVTTNADATDRAFAIWLEDFSPSTQKVWDALLRMERERWADVAGEVNSYIARLPRGQGTAFVSRLAVSAERNVRDLLTGIDPSPLTQSKLAEAQRKFLADATNSSARREALRRIQALKLMTKDARAQLAEQVFRIAALNDSAAKDVFAAFPDYLSDAPRVKARWQSLKKKVSPSLTDRLEKFGKNILRL